MWNCQHTDTAAVFSRVLFEVVQANETQGIPWVFREVMVRPRSRGSYALRQLKSPLSNISSLGLAGLKSTGTFVIQGVTHR